MTDVDFMSYTGKPINEVVFWHQTRTIELPAFNIVLKPEHKRRGSDAGPAWFVRQLW